MTTQLNSMGAVVLGGTALPATNLSYNPNATGGPFRHDDREFNSIQTITGSAPILTFQTPIKNAIDVVGLRITRFTAFDFYLAKYTNGVHVTLSDKYTEAAGAVCVAMITGFNAAQGGIVLASISVFLLSADGDADPLATETEAIPAISEPLLHTLGPVTLNNVVTNGVQSVDGQLNPQWNTFFADGKLYTQDGTYDGGNPLISITHGDPVAILGTDFIGLEITALTKVVLNAIDAVTQVPTAVGAITITIADGRIMPRTVSTSVGEIATVGVDIIGLSDAAQTHPWVIS